MRLAALMLVVGVVLILVGVFAPGPWAGTLAGATSVIAGWVRLERVREERAEERRRERRPGYVYRPGRD